MSEIRKANTIPGLARPALAPAPEPAEVEAVAKSPVHSGGEAAINGSIPSEASALDPQRRVAVNHRLRGAVADRLAGAAQRLEAAGYRASRAELLEAFIYFRLPESEDELMRLVERWRNALARPPGER